jgi:hypothetical protein
MNTNLQDVLARIQVAADRSGRRAEDVKLIAVTKYVGAEAVRPLVAEGCIEIGESRPQELWEKAEQLSDLPIHWHLVGHLQRNKVKRTIALTSLIHSVDSRRLLQSIDESAREQSRVVDVLLEINISGQAAKHGFSGEDLPAVLEFAGTMSNVRVCGLMGMAGLDRDADRARREFASLRLLKERYADLASRNRIHLHELSMGMSGDFEDAILEGATLVRIGSLLFA